MKKQIFLSIYFIPIIVSFLFEILFQSYRIDSLYNLIENTIFYTLVLLLIVVLKTGKLKKFLFGIAYFALGLFIWFEGVFYYIYGINFNASIVYLLLETNIQESLEYLDVYLNLTISCFSFLILTVIIFCYAKLRNQLDTLSFFPNLKRKYIIGSSIGLLFISFAFLKFTTLIVFNLPYLFVKTGIQYYQESKKFNDLALDTKQGSFKNISRSSTSTEETYVFIFGESTARNKMQLYGYHKNNTPLLQEIKDELLVFTDVISPHTYTVESLAKVLTLSNYRKPERIANGSIIQLMNAAGFTTYWLSNQRPIGMHETLLTKIAKSADVQKFINIADYNQKTPYDLELIEPLQKALLEPSDKKAIFIHLLGTHVNYNNRYPKEFEYFKPAEDTEKGRIQAQYDNAIMYNDFVIREIIETVRKQQGNSYVLYLSDHGEEVFDTIDDCGHFEGWNTKTLYEIPFILWMSPKFKKTHPTKFNLNNKFMTDEFIHAASDLSRIQFEGFNKKRSIFSVEFEKQPRIIQKNKDFDKIYNSATKD